MSIATAVARTIKRLMVGGRVTDGVTWIQKLYEGLSKEFNRVNDLKETVRQSVIPHDALPEAVLDDAERKYGIANYPTAGLTADERRARIIGRAKGDSSGGPEWLQTILQQEGFDLYVLTDPTETPSDVPGELIVSSPPGDANIVYAIQVGSFQVEADPGTTSTQVGSHLFEGETNPRALTYSKPAVATQRMIYLSPFADRLAVAGELLSVTETELAYLRKLVIQVKYTRDWCIAQVEVT